MADLSQARVLMLAADGFETVELFKPRQALEEAGAKVTLASLKSDPIQGMEGDINKAETATPDLTVDEVDTDDYDALVIPGGTCNPDKLRLNERAVEIVTSSWRTTRSSPPSATAPGCWPKRMWSMAAA